MSGKAGQLQARRGPNFKRKEGKIPGYEKPGISSGRNANASKSK